MLCCLLAALVVGPLAFIVAPFRGGTRDCCARPRAWRTFALAGLVLLVAAACVFVFLARGPHLCVFPIGGNTQLLPRF